MAKHKGTAPYAGQVRTKRPKREPPWQENEVPEPWRKLYRPGRPGEPFFIPVLKRAFWLDARGPSAPWIEALEAIDKLDDKKPLLSLLRSNRELPPEARVYLADFIERYNLKRPANAPRLPAYDRSDAELRVWKAGQYARAYERMGMSRPEARKKAAKEHSIDVHTLINSIEGRRGSSRLWKKRHPPISP